ncbi:unnamed protein product [Paramecium sonneborni]|uniref:Transmembrane protein n=1 Tax=Paramecium sonneborni TaxID=65129 RepID=A0A8S1NHI4_9CILI|nr:unnamed protein product [Paramecium sonneborni]
MNNQNRIPKADLKKVVDSQFHYERRKYIFWAFNTSYLGIAFFQIYSDVVIEGGENPALCVDTALLNHDLQCPIGLYKTLVALIVAHLIQMLSATIGYFGIDQKSRKINKSYSILLVGSYIYDLITSFILWFSYNTWDDTPFRNTKNEFLMLSIFFPALMAVVGYFCLSQFKKATYENSQMQQAKDELLEKYPQIASDVVKMFL